MTTMPRPFPVWEEVAAKTNIGAYCIVQANDFDTNDCLIETEQFHGTVTAADSFHGILFTLRGKRDSDTRIGPPDLSVFELPPEGGRFTLSDTGEMITNPTYFVFCRSYASNSMTN